MLLRNKRIFRVIPTITLLFVLIMSIQLVACGYRLGGSEPSVVGPMGDGSKTLKVKSVEQPTMFLWLPYVVRSNLRDEINARNLATWVDSGDADYQISIKINSFTMRSSVRDKNQATLIFTGSVSLEANIYDGKTNQIIWRSGGINYYNTYENRDERAAAEELTKDIMRILAQHLREVF